MDETTLTELAYEKAFELMSLLGKLGYTGLAEGMSPIVDVLFNEVKDEHGQA